MKIDKEYATQLMDEVKWLSNHGIKYTFVKVTEEKITIYKYKNCNKVRNEEGRTNICRIINI